MPENDSLYTYDHPLVPYAVQYTPRKNMDISKEDDALIELMFPAIAAGDQRAVGPLKELIRKYPGDPSLKNHLYAIICRWPPVERGRGGAARAAGEAPALSLWPDQ